MAILTLDELLNCEDLPEKVVDTPLWRAADGSDGQVKIKALTKEQKRLVRQRSIVADAHGNPEVDEDLVDLHILIEGIIEPKLTIEHVAHLKERNGNQVDELVGAILRINRMDKGALEEAQKQFPVGPGTEDGVPAGEGDGDAGVAVPSPDAGS